MTAAEHSYSAYANGRCRCPLCTEAWRDHQKAARARRAVLLMADPHLATHGSLSTYTNWMCRCASCTAASTQARSGKARR